MNFKLESEFKKTSDQEKSIKLLTEGFLSGKQDQVLMGGTGTGKTFTMAGIIQNLNKPTLVVCHNKTLAAQLYNEFKTFFPNNLVEYYVSHFDYYQPECYLPITNQYIQKDSMINEEIEKMRLSTISSLSSGRNDVLVISSVSCIFGAGNPKYFKEAILNFHVGDRIPLSKFLLKLAKSFYHRVENELESNSFLVKGDVVTIQTLHDEIRYRFQFNFDEIERIEQINSEGKKLSSLDEIYLTPGAMHILPEESINDITVEIRNDLNKQIIYFLSLGSTIEAKRIEERTNYDIEMIKELGYVNGIENYSRYIDKRLPGDRPYCILDHLPEGSLLLVDECHVTIPQIRAMYHGSFAMKSNLVDYGFRLPSALDARPLKFDEFNSMRPKTIYVSATPSPYELTLVGGEVVEQMIRPTGILDPTVEIRPSKNQIDDLLDEIQKTIKQNERVIVLTIDKKTAENVDEYLRNLGYKSAYLHGDFKADERVQILNKFRSGIFDILVGINLLREGLDIPEASFLAILDADKEGFLRNYTSFIQSIGRVARNANGRAIMYADKITGSMTKAIDELNRRREIQMQYNVDFKITPTTIKKSLNPININPDEEESMANVDNELTVDFSKMKKTALTKLLKSLEKKMYQMSRDLDFVNAIKYRDRINQIKLTIKP